MEYSVYMKTMKRLCENYEDDCTMSVNLVKNKQFYDRNDTVSMAHSPD